MLKNEIPRLDRRDRRGARPDGSPSSATRQCRNAARRAWEIRPPAGFEMVVSPGHGGRAEAGGGKDGRAVDRAGAAHAGPRGPGGTRIVESTRGFDPHAGLPRSHGIAHRHGADSFALDAGARRSGARGAKPAPDGGPADRRGPHRFEESCQ